MSIQIAGILHNIISNLVIPSLPVPSGGLNAGLQVTAIALESFQEVAKITGYANHPINLDGKTYTLAQWIQKGLDGLNTIESLVSEDSPSMSSATGDGITETPIVASIPPSSGSDKTT